MRRNSRSAETEGRARHLFEHVVTQVELPTLEPRPRDVSTAQPGCKSVDLEGTAVEYAVVGIDIGDQSVLDVEPIALQALQRRGISIGTPALSIRAAAAMYRPR